MKLATWQRGNHREGGGKREEWGEWEEEGLKISARREKTELGNWRAIDGAGGGRILESDGTGSLKRAPPASTSHWTKGRYYSAPIRLNWIRFA